MHRAHGVGRALARTGLLTAAAALCACHWVQGIEELGGWAGAGGAQGDGGRGAGSGTAAPPCWGRMLVGDDSLDLGGMAVTEGGDVWLAGAFSGALRTEDGATTLASAGKQDMFLVGLSKDGAVTHATRFGTGFSSEAASALAASDDGLFVTGRYRTGGLDLGCPSTLPGSGAGGVFTARFDGRGQCVALVEEELEASATSTDIVRQGDGALVAGTSADDEAIFVRRVGGDLTFAAECLLDLAPKASLSRARVATSGEIAFIAGDLDGGTLTAHCGQSTHALGAFASAARFVAAVPLPSNASAPAVWITSLGLGGEQELRALAVDGERLFAAGWFDGSITLGGQTESSTGRDALLLALSPAAGDVLWSVTPAHEGDEWIEAIAADPAGGVVVAGTFVGSIDLGGGALVSEGLEDIFVADFDAQGAHRWSLRLGGPGADLAKRVAVRAAGGSVHLAGTTDASLDVGCGETLSGDGSQRLFVVEIPAPKAHF